MKTIQFERYGDPDVLQLTEVAQPTPKPGEALVKVAYAGVNFSDTMFRRGQYPIPAHFPVVPGNEIAGTVVALGESVVSPPVGARVIGLVATGGAYAEFVAVPAQLLAPVPDGIPLDQATGILVQGLTAYGLLHKAARVRPGQWVLVQAAAGGVGSMAVQIAKLAGAKVIGAASGDKLAQVKALGADVAVNYRDADWAEQVRKATGGNGVDVVLETVGGNIGRESMSALARNGQIVVYGISSGQPAQYSTADLMGHMATIRTFSLNDTSPEAVAWITDTLGTLVTWLAQGKLKIHVQQFALAEVAQAHRAVEGRHTTGKVVLAVA